MEERDQRKQSISNLWSQKPSPHPGPGNTPLSITFSAIICQEIGTAQIQLGVLILPKGPATEVG